MGKKMPPAHSRLEYRPPAPVDEEHLLRRCRDIAGCCLAELAERCCHRVPPSLRGNAGWMGRVVEAVLGAASGSRPEPDFASLGVELKTLSVSLSGRPKGDAFICSLPVARGVETWEHSLLVKKLRRVLWVPIISRPGQAPGQRRIGTARIWSPTAEQWLLLRADWEELMDCVRLDGMVPPTCGVCLTAKAVTSGRWRFYLRARFLRSILPT